MRVKKFTRPLTIVLQEDLYDQIKEETDAAATSLSHWFRDAAQQKIKNDKEVMQHVEEKQNSSKQ